MPARSRTHPLIFFLALIGLVVVRICSAWIVVPFLWGFVTGSPPPWLP